VSQAQAEKIVFDTNIYISALAIPGGNAEKAYLHAIDGDFELCTFVAILTSPISYKNIASIFQRGIKLLTCTFQ